MPKQILLVGDKSEQCTAIRSLLEQKGYLVCEVGHRLDALKMAAVYHPDLILMDNVQVDSETVEFCKSVTTNLQTRLIPVILYSEDRDPRSHVRAYNSGVDYFVVKGEDGKEVLPILVETVFTRVSQRMLRATA